MKQAIKIFFLFGAMIVFKAATAQDTGLFNKNLNETSNRLGGKLTGEVYYFSLLENSNYFINPDWVDGSITLKNGEVFDRLKLRYMAFGDQLVVYNTNNKILFKVDKNTVRTFSFKDKVYGINDFERTFINLDSAGISRTGFCEILYQGNVDFLIFHEIIENILTVPYRDDHNIVRDNVFEKREAAYLLTGRYGLVRFKYKNNAIASYYPENRKEIKRVLRKNHIRVNNRKSAATAVAILDKEGLLK